jgi:hypothetical protein
MAKTFFGWIKQGIKKRKNMLLVTIGFIGWIILEGYLSSVQSPLFYIIFAITVAIPIGFIAVSHILAEYEKWRTGK